MPQINLSSLSGPELRQVLDASRRRGDAALSYKVLQEMAARREAPAAEKRSFRKRRGGEAAGMVVDLEEPAETDDLPPLPAWLRKDRDGAAALDEPDFASAHEASVDDLDEGPAEPATRLAAEPEPGLRLDDPEPAYGAAPAADDDGLRLAPQRPGPSRPAKKPRKPIRPPLGFAIGLALGAAVGWGVAIYREAPSAAPSPVQTAALSPPAAGPPPSPAADTAAASPDQVDGALTPPGATQPPSETAAAAPNALPNAAAAPPPSPAVVPKAGAPKAPATAPEAVSPLPPAAAQPPAGAPAPPSAPATTLSEEAALAEPPTAQSAAQPGAKGCAALATPADRTICGDPQLKRLQKSLQKAYAEALAAHEDRALLRQRQLAWRDARNGISDPDRLAKLYEDRIRKLEAATAQASRQRHGLEAPH